MRRNDGGPLLGWSVKGAAPLLPVVLADPGDRAGQGLVEVREQLDAAGEGRVLGRGAPHARDTATEHARGRG